MIRIMAMDKNNKPELWTHQRRGINKVVIDGNNRFCYFFDTGTGKTRTVISVFELIRADVNKALIIAPLNVCRNWPQEFKEYSDLEIPFFMVAGQSRAKKIKEIEAFHACGSTAILCINSESLAFPDYVNAILRQPVQLIVVDESHDFKSFDSKRSVGLQLIDFKFKPKYFFMLSGTPTPQGEVDLWTPLTFMGKNNLPFPIWRKKHFMDVNNTEEHRKYLEKLHGWLKSKYLTDQNFYYWKKNLAARAYHSPSPIKPIWQALWDQKLITKPFIEWSMELITRLKAFPDYKIRPEAKPILNAQLSDCSMYVNKHESLDLPPLLRTKVFFDLDPKNRRIYDDMAKHLLCDIGGKTVEASNAMTRILRLQQIAAGYVEDNEISDARLSALNYAIDQTAGSQFLIWSIFVPTYKQIAQVLADRGLTYGFLIGDMSASKRWEVINDFQDGKLQAIIANPRAGGVGINLTAAAYSIHYTKDFNLVNDMQCEARNYRGGSERHEKITRIDILGADTVDEQIHEALIQKKTLQELIMTLQNFAKRPNVKREVKQGVNQLLNLGV